MKTKKVVEMLAAQAVAYMLDSRTSPATSGVLGNVTKEVMRKYMSDEAVDGYLATMEKMVMVVMVEKYGVEMANAGMKDA